MGGGRELLVDLNGKSERAFEEQDVCVRAEVGDTVLLNTTGVRLGLGTGGVHFVVSAWEKAGLGNHDATELPGHIMKLRYTPLQRAVHAVEEQDHPLHEHIVAHESLDHVPVVICELHSMVPAVAMSLQYELKQSGQAPCRIAYVMTDGAALPIAFSKTVRALKELGLLSGTVTVGHAYGGDLEAVNLYSGLLAAKHAMEADVIIVAMGPGIVGTATKYGHTGIEVGQVVNAVHTLGGDPIVVPRLSFADPRPRHQGISHHTLTALGQVALAKATVPLPNLTDEETAQIFKQIRSANLHDKHQLVGVSGRSILDAANHFQVPLRTMGRTLQEDPAFFFAAGAAGEWTSRLIKKPLRHHAVRSSAGALLADKN
ncbi:hypothetical protein CIG75_08525 [Tumebacillus algifaecis]|uniref:DUF3866 domain-containing protein n=2 Tax=Tumebacillus algifaecis TaxID=1214604 RepID=A0A223D6G5_9BACL|nr:hypothetical protein CIG75_08525 [Tumebacillus algifaecis]